MSYIIQEPSNFINIKLTDTGRRLLSLGRLTFNKVIFSDREINYSLGRFGYNLCQNRILSPKDNNPTYTNSGINFDNSDAINIVGSNLISARQIVSAMTDSVGFFSGDTNNFYIKSNSTIENGGYLGVAEIDYSQTIPSGGTEVNFSTGGYSANTGDLVYIPWEPPQYSSITNGTNVVYSGYPNVSMWYRIKSITGTTVELDRNTPNFGTNPISGSLQKIQSYFYPFNGIQTYYGSATTVNCGVWNMNIIRTTSEIGTTALISGFTTYGSIEYNGTKQYLGFDNDTKAFGVIHYTNNYSGNTYAEQLLPTTVEMYIPNIMWHKKPSATIGQEMESGLILYDYYGDTLLDMTSMAHYRELRDGISSDSNIVGRVYHKLKIIVITDQELLNALTYKSNRNYTLPKLNASLRASNSIENATGLCKSDYSYFVTYTVSSKEYENDVSYGYPQTLPCGYIERIDGQSDVNYNGSVLALNFPNMSFPFMRNTTNMSSLSGTGWNANQVQILLQEVETDEFTTIGELPTDEWVLISDGIGRGIFTGDTINPQDLQSHTFLLSMQDYESGTTYSLNGEYSAFTMNNDYLSYNGLTFGNETFFYGNIKTGIQANVYKTIITLFARNDEYNSSENSTFDSEYDDDTFITEIGILNDNNEVVAVAKPSYPMKKNEGRFLSFQLELDF